MAHATRPIADRFWEKVDKQPDGCWLWKFARNGAGYGIFSVTSRHPVGAHRFARTLLGLPDINVRNVCGQNHCVNPDHWKLPESHKLRTPKPPPEEVYRRRFLSRIRKVVRVPALGRGACWEWQASLTKGGYGRFVVGGRKARRFDYAHIYAYTTFVGPVPDGLELDHLCRNRRCCNPDHLEAVTHQENLARSPIHPFFNADIRDALRQARPRRTHCKHGHALTADNRGNNGRCKECNRLHAKRHYDSNRTNNEWLERENARRRNRRALRSTQEAA